MFVSCPAARFHATSRTMCVYVYAYMYAICTRYACGSAGTSLLRKRGTSTHCMHAAARHFQYFTHYMHAAARALSVFHFQGSAAAPGHVGGDGSAGLQRVRVCWGLRSSWWSVSWSVSCSPVALRVWFVLSCCQRSVMLSAMYAHDLARLRNTC